ncbi:GNAT family N-acetyltransferase [Halobacillus shinanisalinarum]|uniref:GNAT family N-acetyltransferase n=1 Tax=Halobacillus shinanisalinarum TaxID=2932258 RepID=A0ABY4GW48_9BACI|nr:GNAT family protein [Halobacillus shinanisalinarum]UOQ92130.1 GNAT family N-acetyltransferase [Halobacillus shinanisalinarum]
MFTLKVDKDLSLKLLEKEDAKDLFALVDESRDSLRRWLPWVDSMKQEEDYGTVIEMWLKQFASHDGFQAGVLYKNNLAGVAGFQNIDWSNQKTSIGYWLSEKYQGYGIMTRAVRVLINYAFENYKLNRVEIQCGVDNQKSNNIPKRLGLKQEGIIRDGEYLYDHYHDCVVYGALSREWKTLNN